MTKCFFRHSVTPCFSPTFYFPLHLIVKKWHPVCFLPVAVQHHVAKSFSHPLMIIDTLWQNVMHEKFQMERKSSQASWHEPDGFDCLAKQYCNRSLAWVQDFALTTWENFGGRDDWFISTRSCSTLYCSTGFVQRTGSVTIQKVFYFKNILLFSVHHLWFMC